MIEVRGTISAASVQLSGTEVILSSATLDTKGRGRGSGSGRGRGASAAQSPGSGGSYGGIALDSCGGDLPPGGVLYGEATEDVPYMGSGGGPGLNTDSSVAYLGGAGGGVIVLEGDVVEIGGGSQVDASGADGEKHPSGSAGLAGGGGSGGSIVVHAGSMRPSIGGGALNVMGGDGSSWNLNGDSSGGGGGRLYVISGDDVPVEVDIMIDGGGSNCGASEAGSYLRQQGFKRCMRERGEADFSAPDACWCTGSFVDTDCVAECTTGYYGADCANQCPECLHGTCSDDVAGTGCVCDDGWDGESCDRCADQRYGANCENTCPACTSHGECDDGQFGAGDCVCSTGWANGSGICDECAPGYYGDHCDQQCPADCGHGSCDEGRSGTGDCVCDADWDNGPSGSCDTCIAGNYGPQCQFTCPACGVNAECDDGPGGVGCVCVEHFVRPTPGADCTQCVAGRFGASCSSVCPDCGDHGICDDDTGGSGLCVCDPHWFGTLCDEACPSCRHGTCNDGRGGTGLCDCDDGWAGDLCDVCDAGRYGPACAFSCGDCGNHGSCMEGVNGTGCVCDELWMRPTVSDDCVECIPGRSGPACLFGCPDCGLHGVCDDGVTGSGLCVCDPQYYGPQCESKCGSCENGECDDGRGGTGECICDDGWAGEACDVCAPGRFGADCRFTCPSTCGEHTTCEEGITGRGCQCDDGWTVARLLDPDDAEWEANGNATLVCECEPGRWGADCEPCPDCPHGTCSEGLQGDGRCECDGHWTGDDCDECETGWFGPSCTGQCPDCSAVSPKRRCEDGVTGSGTCVCVNGWVGSECEFCSPQWDGAACDLCGHGFYREGATCVACDCDAHHATCDTETGECTCDPGWDPATKCFECEEDHYGPDCVECPAACGSFTVCSSGREGTGECICRNGYDGEQCGLVRQDEFCVHAAPSYAASNQMPPLPVDLGLCLPGSDAFERGFDLTRGSFSPRRVLAVGYDTSSTTQRTYAGERWDVPQNVGFGLHGDGTGDLTEDAVRLTQLPLAVGGNGNDVRAYYAARRLRISSGLDDTESRSEVNIDGSLVRHDGFAAHLDALGSHRVLAGAGAVVPAYQLTNAGIDATRDFVRTVNALPAWPTASTLPTVAHAAYEAYDKLFCDFGTHYVSGVLMGGAVEVTASMSLCADSVGDLLSDSEAVARIYGALNASLLSPSAMQVDASLADTPGAFAGLSVTRSVIGGDESILSVLAPEGAQEALKQWGASALGDPGIVQLSIRPITELADAAGVSDARLAMLAEAWDEYMSTAAREEGGDVDVAATTDTSTSTQCTSRATDGGACRRLVATSGDEDEGEQSAAARASSVAASVLFASAALAATCCLV